MYKKLQAAAKFCLHNTGENILNTKRAFLSGWGRCESEMIPEFVEWYNNLTPDQKCTVHPPAGSDGSYGIYTLSIPELLTKFKTERGY